MSYIRDGKIPRDSKGKMVWPVKLSHFPEGPCQVYSDGDGHYSAITADGNIIAESLACDYCAMKALEFNRNTAMTQFVPLQPGKVTQ